MNNKMSDSPSLHKKIFQKRMNDLRLMDKQIRKNWNNLYCHRIKPLERFNSEKWKDNRTKTEPADIQQSINRFNPHQVTSLKAQKQRQHTIKRIKQNNDIFFRKKNNSSPNHYQARYSSPVTQSKQKDTNVQLSKHRSEYSRFVQKTCLPLMLQSRGKTLDKQLTIIGHQQMKNIQSLKRKMQLKQQLNKQQQLKLINRFKGTKLYYRFIKQWKMPLDKDEEREDNL